MEKIIKWIFNLLIIAAIVVGGYYAFQYVKKAIIMKKAVDPVTKVIPKPDGMGKILPSK